MGHIGHMHIVYNVPAGGYGHIAHTCTYGTCGYIWDMCIHTSHTSHMVHMGTHGHIPTLIHTEWDIPDISHGVTFRTFRTTAVIEGHTGANRAFRAPRGRTKRTLIYIVVQMGKNGHPHEYRD
jgi:hypothetical protein